MVVQFRSPLTTLRFIIVSVCQRTLTRDGNPKNSEYSECSENSETPLTAHRSPLAVRIAKVIQKSQLTPCGMNWENLGKELGNFHPEILLL